MKTLAVVLIIFIQSDLVFSGEKVVEIQSENYIAHGYSDKSSKELAKLEACNLAKKELISYVFGAAFQINQNMIRSLGVMDYSQDFSINTGEIVLRAAMTETNLSDDVTKCTITYPTQEANIEKERLKSSQNNNSIRFTEIGDPNNIKGGVLEIVTIPDETDVFIDNVRWGTTPLRLNGKLNVGTHTIRLDNPNYKIVEEKVVIGNASKNRVERILKRATGKVKIISDPEGATVKINEEVIQYTPTNEIELLAGQKLKIEVNHPETETNVQYITLIRDEVKTLNQKLLLRPGFISLNVIPNADVLIEIDGVKKPFLSPNSWIQLEAGVHEVAVSAKEYARNVITVDVRGGERKAIPTIELVTLKSIEEKRISEEKKQKEEQELVEEELRNQLADHHILLGIESNFNVPKYSDSSIGFHLGYQKSLFRNILGLQLSGSFGAENKVEEYNSSDSNVGKPNSTKAEKGPYSYQTILASMPIYLGSFYLNPGYGIRYDQTTEKTTRYDSRGTATGRPVERKIKTHNNFYSYSAGFIFPKNDEPSKGSVYIEGGINRYKGFEEKDTVIKLGYRWNF